MLFPVKLTTSLLNQELMLQPYYAATLLPQCPFSGYFTIAGWSLFNMINAVLSDPQTLTYSCKFNFIIHVCLTSLFESFSCPLFLTQQVLYSNW